MELKLENGRYLPARFVGLERTGGTQELLQRVLMKLKARRGGFFPLPNYGSRLYTLGSVKAAMRETAAKQFVQEALADEPELFLDSLELAFGKEGEILIFADFTYNGETKLSVNTRI